jgi:hypothetical protein
LGGGGGGGSREAKSYDREKACHSRNHLVLSYIHPRRNRFQIF